MDEVREDDTPSEIPKGIFSVVLALILVSLIPGAMVLRMRSANSDSPRWHVFFDMDFQPKKKPQQTTTLFADSRTQRPPVPGTVARGELNQADPYYLGYDPDQTAMLESTDGTRMVAFKAQDQQAAATTPAAATPAADGAAAAPAQTPAAPAAAAGAAGEPNYAWLTEFPIEATDELFALGKKKFETNCAVCHGFAGYGDGLVSQRAVNLAQGYWLQPTSLHEERIQKQALGRIYYTVANGKGKMAGYASSLNPRERWAVVLYVRALQRSQNASMEDVPEARRGDLSAN